MPWSVAQDIFGPLLSPLEDDVLGPEAPAGCVPVVLYNDTREGFFRVSYLPFLLPDVRTLGERGKS